MIDEVLRAVAAHGLPGDRPPPPEVPDDRIEELLREAAPEKLLGLLDQAVADGAVAVSRHGAERIGEEAVRTQAWCLLVERHHLEVHRLLTDAGIDTRFLKGPSAAHRFYEHPALRPFVDVDVLIRSADLDRAVDLLMGAGHTRNQPEPVPGFSARYGKSVTLRSPAGIEVDLHRTLASGPYGLVRPPDALWRRTPAHVRLGTADLAVLDPSAAFAHACIHAVTGRRARLGSLRDVVQLAGPSEDALKLAEQLRAAACLVQAARLATEALGPPATAPLRELEQAPVSRRDQRWLTLYTQTGSYRSVALRSASALPVVDRPRYLVMLARAGRSSGVSRRDGVDTAEKG